MLGITGPRDLERRLPGSVSVVVAFVEGESILLALDLAGIAASSGSACTTGSVEPSHVLVAMGMPPELARGSLRFTLGRMNTDEDVKRLLELLRHEARAARPIDAASADRSESLVGLPGTREPVRLPHRVAVIAARGDARAAAHGIPCALSPFDGCHALLPRPVRLGASFHDGRSVGHPDELRGAVDHG